jgi:hypothetical protein
MRLPAEPPDIQAIWNMALTALAGGAAWVMRHFAGRADETEKQVAATRELLLREYAPKTELLPRLDRLDSKLDRLLDNRRDHHDS